MGIKTNTPGMTSYTMVKQVNPKLCPYIKATITLKKNGQNQLLETLKSNQNLQLSGEHLREKTTEL